MPLNQSTLASELETAIRSSQGLDGTPYAQLSNYCSALAGAIIDHFKDNASLKDAVAAGFTEEVETTGPNINKSELIAVPVTGGIE